MDVNIKYNKYIKNKQEELKIFEHLILFSVFATVIPIVLPVYFERLVSYFYVSYNSMSLNSRSCLVTIVLHLLFFFGNFLSFAASRTMLNVTRGVC